MIRRIEIIFGALDGVTCLALLAVAIFLPLSTESVCTTNVPCVTRSPSVWGQQPLEAIGYLVAGLGLPALLFGLIYLHARTRNSSLLALIWILGPIFLAAVFLLAFTIFGMAAFFLAVFTLLAAITGSALQTRGFPSATMSGR